MPTKSRKQGNNVKEVEEHERNKMVKVKRALLLFSKLSWSFAFGHVKRLKGISNK